MVAAVAVAQPQEASSVVAMGRGNRRKRKRRRFFDEEFDAFDDSQHEVEEEEEEWNKPPEALARTSTDEDVRSSVFRPKYDPSGSKGAQVESRSVLGWTAEDVAALARRALPGQLGERTAARLVEEEVDGEALTLLAQSDLIHSLGMRLGPALKLFNAILGARASVDV